jgi:hypothetical protein
VEGVPAAEQFPVDPGKLVQAFQELLVGLHPATALKDLGLVFEQEGSHLTFGQAAAQVEEGAVFLALMAMAIGVATFEEAFQEGGMDGIGREGEGAQEVSFALAQGEGGEALEFVLTHNMSKIPRFAE